jgi:hypothetical protein
MVSIVKSLDEAIPALAAYYEAKPPQWKPERESELCRWDADMRCPRYVKEIQFGPLWVDAKLCLGNGPRIAMNVSSNAVDLRIYGDTNE